MVVRLLSSRCMSSSARHRRMPPRLHEPSTDRPLCFIGKHDQDKKLVHLEQAWSATQSALAVAPTPEQTNHVERSPGGLPRESA
jgi:hypothetical protein